MTSPQFALLAIIIGLVATYLFWEFYLRRRK